MPPMTPVVNHAPRVKVAFKEEVQSLKRIDSENNLMHHGFVSYRDFSKTMEGKPLERVNAAHMMKMKPMTSLEDFDATSVKNPSIASKRIAVNPKLTAMQNAVKQLPKTSRPSSSTSIPTHTPILCRTNTNPFVSATYIPHPQNQPFHQVIVRYSWFHNFLIMRIWLFKSHNNQLLLFIVEDRCLMIGYKFFPFDSHSFMHFSA